MKAHFCFFLVAVSFLVGCGKTQRPPAAAATGTSPLNAAAEYGGALANGQNKAVATIDVAALDQAIELFNVQEGRFPKNLDELVEKKLMSVIPDAPRGMKLSYDAATGTVKLVKAE
jgi:hypothetical protein